MPTIDIEYAEFEKLLGIELHKNMDKANDVLAYVKGEVKLWDEKADVMSIEIKDTGRPDLWNVEGMTRALRGFLGLEEGLKEYKVGKSIVDIHVNAGLRNIRPFIGCSVVKNLELSDAVIRGFMHMQDKLDQSYGRNRQRTSIGLYEFDLIKTPLTYGIAKPTETSFIPLGFTEKMNLKEILKKHPKGLEYGQIVNKHPVYPILLDAEGKVLSFPPVINSNDLGKITDQTRNVLVEVTGTNEEAVLNVLKIVTLSLIDRGGKAYAANVYYPKRKEAVVTPCFEARRMDLNIEFVNKLSGLRLKAKDVADLLAKAGYNVEKISKDKVSVWVPSHRVDVMHPVDLVEDVTIAYGYNNIKPFWRNLPTIGSVRPEQRLLDIARELMVGLGFQEILTNTLTNPDNLFTKMNMKKQHVVEIANPKVQTLACLRNWLLPGLLEVLSNNLSVGYPQKIFELGKITVPDGKRETKTRDENWLATVTSHSSASFSEIKSHLEAFFMNLGLEWQIKEAKHSSFMDGRTGAVIVQGANVGILGEIHPNVLATWKIENPTIAFEINMEKIVKIKGKNV
jgi:phenylalanyl-tRNA synthetase beta chain